MPLSHTLKNGSDGELYVIKDKKKGKNLREQKRGTTGNRHVRRVSWCGRRFKSQDPGGGGSVRTEAPRTRGAGSRRREQTRRAGEAHRASSAVPGLSRAGASMPWPDPAVALLEGQRNLI